MHTDSGTNGATSTSSTSRLQAVIFDLDGVITDTAEHHYLAWRVIAEELGLPFSRAFNEKLKGVSRIASLQLLLSLGEQPQSYSEEQLEQLASHKNEIYKKLIETITPADVLPGIPEFLKQLKQNGIKIGLASASKNALAVLEGLQMRAQFDVIVDVRTLQRNKPDPEIFLRAAELLGVEPQHCIGVEDAIAGVDAIKAAGMFAVAIGESSAFPHADVVLTNTAQLRLQMLLPSFA